MSSFIMASFLPSRPYQCLPILAMVPEAGPLSVPWWLKNARTWAAKLSSFLVVFGGGNLDLIHGSPSPNFQNDFGRELRGNFRQEQYTWEMWGVARAPGPQM